MIENNERIIYSARLTRFLIEKGFKFKRIIPDIYKEGFSNWVFEDTEGLVAAIKEYKALTTK